MTIVELSEVPEVNPHRLASNTTFRGKSQNAMYGLCDTVGLEFMAPPLRACTITTVESHRDSSTSIAGRLKAKIDGVFCDGK
jgi:hypothetical protein